MLKSGRQGQSVSTKLYLSVLGGFVLHDAHGKQISIKNRKACGLLAYLCLHPHCSETRERLAGLLWSERGEEQARASLRQCLKQIRAVFDEVQFDGFHAGRQSVSVEDGAISIDLEEIFENLEMGELDHRLLDREDTPERILYGYEDLDESYGAWLHVLRQNWRDRLVDKIRSCMMTAGVDSSKRAAEALLAIDLTHEEAHRHLISHHAATGNTGAAIKQYNELWDLLGHEYDMEPDDETQALIAEVKSGKFRDSHQSAAISVRPSSQQSVSIVENGPLPELYLPPVIGIGAFLVGGAWQGEDYLVSGFRRELIAALIRFREWIIVEAANAATSIGIEQPGGRLDYRLEGTYSEDAGEVNVVLTLQEQKTQRYIWSERCALSLDQWFEGQVVLVRRIALAMNVYLSTERLTQQIAKQDIPFEAYSKWLKGQYDMLIWSTEKQAQAEDTFREITQIAPTFAPAFSSLAAVHNTRHIRNPGMHRQENSVQEALECSKISVELDPLDTRNHLALAWSNAMAQRYDQAELHFSMAHELNPNSPTTLVPCAHGLSYCGNREMANQLAEAAINLNPGMPAFHWGYIGCMRYFDGDFAGSVSALETAQDVITDLVAWRAAAQAMLGAQEEAKKTAQKFVSLASERWQSADEPTAENITSWLVHCFPIRRHEDLELLREGLKKAGLPIAT